MMKKLPIVIAALLLVTTTATSQWWKTVTHEDVLLTQVGFAAHSTLTMHTGSFVLPFAPTCCTEYSSALGIGPSLSIFLRQEVVKPLRLTLRGSFTPMNATFETDEQELFTNSVDGVIRHTLETNQSLLWGEFIADVRVVDPIRAMVGVGAGTFIQATYSQREQLIIPGTGTFENGRRTRNETTDAELFNTSSPFLNLLLGVGFDLPITENRSVVVTPEVMYGIGLTPVVQDITWNVNNLRIGAAIAFSLNAPEPPVPVERVRETFIDSVFAELPPDGVYRREEGAERIVIDTTVTPELVTITENVYRVDTVYVPELPDVNASVKVLARQSDGSMSEDFVIQVSTQFVSEALPLLPSVFFEPESISLSFRYKQIKPGDQFSESAIPTRTTAVHREVLNVIGSRMAAKPNTTIKLRGTADPTTENARCDLAYKRATAVRQYLENVWNISADRIEIVNSESGTNCPPPRATREQSEAGFSENRRVDIETSDIELLEPVAQRRFNEARTINPPELFVETRGSSTNFVEAWTVNATSGQSTIFTKSGKGAATSFSQQLSTAAADGMAEDKPLVVSLKLDAIRGVTAQASDSILVRRDTLSTEIERLTLTLFGIASDEVTNVAEEQIKQFVKNVPQGSVVTVRGYADMLGNAEFNRQLSAKRADAVCKTIKRYLTKRIDLQCTDIATDRFPPGIESYDTPEERFLSRTVQIEIKKSR